MSEFERSEPPLGRERGPMPAAIILATVFAGGVVIFWCCVPALLMAAFGTVPGAPGVWMLASAFAAALGVVGAVGCVRRSVWVRWAALAQTLVVGATLGFVMPLFPPALGVIVILVIHAGLQFLPSSHRWYHPQATVSVGERRMAARMIAPGARMPATVIIATILDIAVLLLGTGYGVILLLFLSAFPAADISPLLWLLPAVLLSVLVLIGVGRRWVATPWLASALALILPCLGVDWDPSGFLLVGTPILAAALLWLPASRRWLRAA